MSFARTNKKYNTDTIEARPQGLAKRPYNPRPSRYRSVNAHKSSCTSTSSAPSAGSTTRPTGATYLPPYLSGSFLTSGAAAAQQEFHAPSSGPLNRNAKSVWMNEPSGRCEVKVVVATTPGCGQSARMLCVGWSVRWRVQEKRRLASLERALGAGMREWV